MYEVYLVSYPTAKSSIQKAFVQTIEDICTLAKGLSIIGIKGADPPDYAFDGTRVSVKSTFYTSISACHINRYECSLDVGGVIKDCNQDDGAGTSSIFDVSTGEFKFSSSNK
jgi:hypothetical protein